VAGSTWLARKDGRECSSVTKKPKCLLTGGRRSGGGGVVPFKLRLQGQAMVRYRSHLHPKLGDKLAVIMVPAWD